METTIFDRIFPGAPIAGGPNHNLSAALLGEGVLLLSSGSHSCTKTNADKTAREGFGELGRLMNCLRNSITVRASEGSTGAAMNVWLAGLRVWCPE